MYGIHKYWGKTIFTLPVLSFLMYLFHQVWHNFGIVLYVEFLQCDATLSPVHMNTGTIFYTVLPCFDKKPSVRGLKQKLSENSSEKKVKVFSKLQVQCGHVDTPIGVFASWLQHASFLVCSFLIGQHGWVHTNAEDANVATYHTFAHTHCIFCIDRSRNGNLPLFLHLPWFVCNLLIQIIPRLV